jgi:TFIIS helical bundle-like domain
MAQLSERTDLQRFLRVAETTAEAVGDSTAECADAKKCVECLAVLQDMHVTAQVRVFASGNWLSTLRLIHVAPTSPMQMLQETGFGPRVRRLRKHANKAIAGAAACVVNAWKQNITDQVPKERKQGKPSAKDVSSAREESRPTQGGASTDARPLCEEANGAVAQKPPRERGPASYTKPVALADPMRNKIRQTVADAILAAVEDDDKGVGPSSMRIQSRR